MRALRHSCRPRLGAASLGAVLPIQHGNRRASCSTLCGGEGMVAQAGAAEQPGRCTGCVLAVTERGSSKRGRTMADFFKEKREKAGTKAISQLEIDAQRMREK